MDFDIQVRNVMKWVLFDDKKFETDITETVKQKSSILQKQYKLSNNDMIDLFTNKFFKSGRAKKYSPENGSLATYALLFVYYNVDKIMDEIKELNK